MDRIAVDDDAVTVDYIGHLCGGHDHVEPSKGSHEVQAGSALACSELAPGRKASHGEERGGGVGRSRPWCRV